MPSYEVDKFLAELRFMGITIPDIYDRIQVQAGHIISLDLDSVDFVNFPHFPNSISKLQRLERISLRFNHLNQVPVELASIPSLQSVNLSHNHIKTLPPELEQMTSLCKLRLNHNLLSDLCHLPPNLQRLNYSYNLLKEINELPAVELESFSLTNNQIESISPDLFYSTLKFLNLRSNQLHQFPELLETTLQKINVYNNPIQWAGTELKQFEGIVFVDHQTKPIQDAMRILRPVIRDLRFLRNYPPQFIGTHQGITFGSLMIYGDDMVGKKRLIKSYLANEFIPDDNLFITQNRYLNWDYLFFQHHQSYFQIWYPYVQDSNDPTYRTSILNGFYYTGAVVLVFDLSDPATFKTVIDALKQIYEIRGVNCPVIVVGNKAELPKSQKISSEKINQSLHEIFIKTKMDISYVEVSVKTRKGIPILFEQIFELFT